MGTTIAFFLTKKSWETGSYQCFDQESIASFLEIFHVNFALHAQDKERFVILEIYILLHNSMNKNE